MYTLRSCLYEENCILASQIQHGRPITGRRYASTVFLERAPGGKFGDRCTHVIPPTRRVVVAIWGLLGARPAVAPVCRGGMTMGDGAMVDVDKNMRCGLSRSFLYALRRKLASAQGRVNQPTTVVQRQGYMSFLSWPRKGVY
jgi:hypothetical protein